MSPATTHPHEEDDPVLASYDVYITPSLTEQMYLLQYPIRDRSQAYNERNGARPTEMRIKPRAGFLEMDVELNPHENFNKYQGLVWGEAMRKAAAGGNATFGAAAGFAANGGIKAGRGGAGRAEGGEASIDANLSHFTDSVNKNYVHRKQTLGGQILHDETGNPNYMLGAFKGKQLHLTRVNGVVQMRPQFHHVDAVTHLESAARRDTAATTAAGAGAGAGAGGDDKRPSNAQAHALAQTYKDTRDVENLEAARAKNLLAIAQDEKWTRLNYYDEDESESYDAYNARLFVSDTAHSKRLKSALSNEQYLDAISAPRVDPSGRKKKKPLTKKQMTAIELAEDDVEHEGEVEGEGVEVAGDGEHVAAPAVVS